MAIKKRPTAGNGDFAPFINPKELEGKPALYIELEGIRRDVPSKFKDQKTGELKVRDVATVQIAAFDTEADIVAGKPSIDGRYAVDGKVLVEDLDKTGVGNGMIVIVQRIQGTQGGIFPVFRDPSDSAYAAVEAFLEKRDAELEEAPDFD